LNIRKANENYVDAIVRITDECGLSPWSSDDSRPEIGSGNSIFLVTAKDDGELTGFILGRCVPSVATNSFVAEIYNIGVSPIFRCTGTGSKLVKTFFSNCLETHISEVFLEVRAGNQTAISFYKKHGFKTVGTRRTFYSNPTEDATVMRAIL
jgi:ribosomal-protein-alanine N-acetyltransferase